MPDPMERMRDELSEALEELTATETEGDALKHAVDVQNDELDAKLEKSLKPLRKTEK